MKYRYAEVAIPTEQGKYKAEFLINGNGRFEIEWLDESTPLTTCVEEKDLQILKGLDIITELEMQQSRLLDFVGVVAKGQDGELMREFIGRVRKQANQLLNL